MKQRAGEYRRRWLVIVLSVLLIQTMLPVSVRAASSAPTSPRIEYPDSVWKHLNSPPRGDAKTRREILMNHWINSPNIITLRKGFSDYTLKRIAGVDQSDISIALLNDRASMLREVKSCVMHMTRPLMELHMVLRGKKQAS